MSNVSTPTDRRSDLVDAVLSVVGHEGLDRATVRRVAEVAGVSIGTVQHWFPTKDDLLAGAFEEVVRRVRARADAHVGGPDVRTALAGALHELLPLDAVRRHEARVQVAFAARASHAPRLAAMQRAVLDEVRGSLAHAFASARGTTVDAECHTSASQALALVDGLALHAVSSRTEPTDGAHLRRCVDTFLDAVL